MIRDEDKTVAEKVLCKIKDGKIAVAECLDNTGYEDKFENGVFYQVFNEIEDYIEIEDMSGGICKMLRERFGVVEYEDDVCFENVLELIEKIREYLEREDKVGLISYLRKTREKTGDYSFVNHLRLKMDKSDFEKMARCIVLAVLMEESKESKKMKKIKNDKFGSSM